MSQWEPRPPPPPPPPRAGWGHTGGLPGYSPAKDAPGGGGLLGVYTAIKMGGDLPGIYP